MQKREQSAGSWLTTLRGISRRLRLIAVVLLAGPGGGCGGGGEPLDAPIPAGDPGAIAQLSAEYADVPDDPVLYAYAAGIARRREDAERHEGVVEILTRYVGEHPGSGLETDIDEEGRLAQLARTDIETLVAMAEAEGHTLLSGEGGVDRVIEAIILRELALEAEELSRQIEAGTEPAQEAQEFLGLVGLALDDVTHGHGGARRWVIDQYDPLPPEPMAGGEST